MDDTLFRRLCDLYGFAPSRVLRELLQAAVAAELRDSRAFAQTLQDRLDEAREQRGALLEALREYRAAILFAQDKQALMSAIKSADDKARAAIAKAEKA